MHLAHPLAVDIAVVLPSLIREEAIRINRLLLEHSGDRTFCFGPEALPHITLAMAAVPEKSLAEISLDDLGRLFPCEIAIAGISTVTTGAGRRVAGFDLAPGETLLALHGAAARTLAAVAVDEEPDLFLREGEEDEPSMAGYVRTFLHAPYSPHITLGAGEATDRDTVLSLPHRFTAHGAALCLVGTGGTCRKVIREIYK
jgi:2'-5' RNA ligase